MKKVLIVSATKNSNYKLAFDIEKLLIDLDIPVKVISLEDFNLPLFTQVSFDANKLKYLETIKNLTKNFIDSKAIIICAPEYNGSIPPILTNSISWISVSTDYWKDAFKNKNAFIATSSGGPGTKFTVAMKMQLEHLGANVPFKALSVNSSTPLKKDSTKKILKQFINLI